MGCCAAEAGVGDALDALSKRGARDVCLTGLVACLLFTVDGACAVVVNVEAQLGRKTIYKKAWLLATPSGFDENAGFDSTEDTSRGYDSTVDLRRLILCISIGSYREEV